MLRKIMIVGAALVLMPTPPDERQSPQQVAAADTSVFSYVAAAADTVADLRGFCERNAAACDIAGKLAVTVEGKAKYSAKLVYEWATEATGQTALSAGDGPEIVADAASKIKMKRRTEKHPPLRLVSVGDEMALEELIIENAKAPPSEG